MVKDLTLDQLLADKDWAELFGEGRFVQKVVKKSNKKSQVSLDPFNRQDIADIIALQNGSLDGADWLGLFRLKDGRLLTAFGGTRCFCNQWDCITQSLMVLCTNLDEVIQYGLDTSQQERLGLV